MEARLVQLATLAVLVLLCLYLVHATFGWNP